MPSQHVLLRAFLIAALVAAGGTSIFHLAVTERSIDRAIQLEEAAQRREIDASGGAAERVEPIFSRRVQTFGLPLGLLLYAIGVGAVFTGTYSLVAAHIGGDVRRRVLLFGAGVVVSVVLVPFSKFPANPPGVGDPGTLARRQLLYIACVLLSVAGLFLAARIHARLRSLGSARAKLAAAAFYVVWVGILLVLLPGRTDPVNTPTRLLWEFRLSSLGGDLLFWLLFIATFAVSLRRYDHTTTGLVESMSRGG